MINNDNPEIESLVTPVNVLTKIWFSPKQVFTFIETHKYSKYVTLLLILSGISKALDKALSKNMGDYLPFWGVIICVILIGISFGQLFNLLLAAALKWAGKWMNGQGDTRSILKIIAYAMIPSICSIFLTAIQFPIYGSLIFQSSLSYLLIESPYYQIYYLYVIIDILLVIWSIILLVIGLSVVQKFSIFKAVLNVVIAAVLIACAALALFLIIDLFQPFPNQSLTRFLF
ncbi:YIP1 family protein [Flavobacterium reichenbachii]|jgi:hypothetical protein|uniref:Yip1 domain-containing protein n=1 Tax=Flavobacterium reichenbachii TaxID=362418 RepID=A0A085ZP48_9FLAO|nr:YIP1 family protein [Flavobacterium reichenbachii]KFF06212.1 hypothetical protein IW19_12015 [Flavobacterium reichenbachii]OXB17569.1 YIP1 family protein [Flavobacterium reichenbachii]